MSLLISILGMFGLVLLIFGFLISLFGSKGSLIIGIPMITIGCLILNIVSKQVGK